MIYLKFRGKNSISNKQQRKLQVQSSKVINQNIGTISFIIKTTNITRNKF